MDRKHEGDPWKVYATGPDGKNVVRVLDGAGVRALSMAGYRVHRVVRVRPDNWTDRP